MPRRLNVLLPCRERANATRIVVEALHHQTKHFPKIDIYCFDNLSKLGNRMPMFENLLKEGKIVHYSYESLDSSRNYFCKPLAYKQWCQLMKWYISNDPERAKYEDYYLLIDNDILMKENWDEYFLTVMYDKNVDFKNIHYLYAASIDPNYKERYKSPKYLTVSPFNKINVSYSYGKQGGSAFWFMNDTMLQKNANLADKVLAKTHGRTKGHDSGVWSILNRSISGSYMIALLDNLAHGLGVGSVCKGRDYEEADKKYEGKTIEDVLR